MGPICEVPRFKLKISKKRVEKGYIHGVLHFGWRKNLHLWVFTFHFLRRDLYPFPELASHG